MKSKPALQVELKVSYCAARSRRMARADTDIADGAPANPLPIVASTDRSTGFGYPFARYQSAPLDDRSPAWALCNRLGNGFRLDQNQITAATWRQTVIC